MIGITRSIAGNEDQKFSCDIESKSKSFIKTSCFSKYQQKYNSPVPFYAYVILSFGLTVVTCIYSLCVKSRVEQRLSSEANHDAHDEMTDDTSYVFNFYIVQLSARCFFGILFTVIQFEVFHYNRFQSEYHCVPSSSYKKHLLKGIIAFNSTSVTCLDLAAAEKIICGIVVAGFHVFFSFISLAELLYVLRRAYLSRATGILFSNDNEFIGSYFLGITMTADLRRLTDNGGEVEEREPKREEYKNEILRRPRPVDIDY